MNIDLKLVDLTQKNATEKIIKAMTSLADRLGIDLKVVEKSKKTGEKHPFGAQEQLWERYLSLFIKEQQYIYRYLCEALGLIPIKNQKIKKSISREARWRIHNRLKVSSKMRKPGESVEDLVRRVDKVLDQIDKVLTARYARFGEDFIFDFAALSRTIAKLEIEQNASPGVVRDTPEGKEMPIVASPPESYNRKQFLLDFGTDQVKNVERRINLMGEYITGINNDTKNKIKIALSQGMLEQKSKAEIAADLFDKFGKLNKDWQRISDTESVNTFNSEYINEHIKEEKPGSKVYFIRREFADNKVCSFCARAPVIARWVDSPKDDENTAGKDDVASVYLWAGKSNYGRDRGSWWWAEGAIHPNCRGYWERFYEELGDLDVQ